MTKKTNNPTLVLKNYHLVPLVNWLVKLSLAGKESRERTRFIKFLGPRLQEISDLRIEMQNKYALKDDKGQPKKKKESSMKIIGEDGKEVESETEGIDFGKNEEKAKDEWNEYQNEEFIIDISEGNKSKVYTVADIILNTTFEFTDWAATMYDEWCECFEALPNRKEI